MKPALKQRFTFENTARSSAVGRHFLITETRDSPAARRPARVTQTECRVQFYNQVYPLSRLNDVLTGDVSEAIGPCVSYRRTGSASDDQENNYE
ncbi:hypothetical protein EVAR_5667_1 [Eumeta japonica]|uniref:Uncharacterized protein n=1 Tax=Eumeta variegata TaxID=151549 RepID=A0A4C1T888_EUMVA|nr:hypothetical protein EVAR_5667_1 [Eumeta japonica]